MKKLKKNSSNTLLVTIDVVSLYTNIPYEDGIEATRRAFDTRENKKIPTETLIRLLEFVLKKTMFRFNGKLYEQKEGTTMRTKMAVMYAIQTMADLEKAFLDTQTHLPLVWWRFIDDIFLLWTWGADLLHELLEDLNEFHPTLKFTAEFSEESINFLDVKIIKVGNKLHTNLYTKPTASHLYLDFTSCYPRHHKQSIPIAQALRIRKICSREDDFEYHLKRLANHFKNRHYSQNIINQAIERARQTLRLTLLEYQEKSTQKVIPFTLTFHPNLVKVSKILSHNAHILPDHPSTKALSEYKIISSFRRARNLRDILVKNDITPTPNTPAFGAYKCGKNCVTCKYLKPVKEISNKEKTYKYILKQHLDCNSRSIIYLLWCSLCGIQYIG